MTQPRNNFHFNNQILKPLKYEDSTLVAEIGAHAAAIELSLQQAELSNLCN